MSRASRRDEKSGSALEFELRLQQFIELCRQGKVVEAKVHAKKWLTSHIGTYPEDVHRAFGLLAFPSNTRAEPYRVSTMNTHLF